MSTPFSVRVAEPAWRDEATAWVVEQLTAHGHRLTGEIEQPRIRPWSTQLVVPTDAGVLWFKHSCRYLSFEPALHRELAALLPGDVDEPYAVDAERGWLLTVDRGPTLHAQREPTADDWRDVVRQAAVMQQALAPHRDRLLTTGMPDCAPDTVLDRFDRLLALYVDQPDENPVHVSLELADRLRGARPRLVDAVAVLGDAALPTTWQHGDLHPGNAFAAGDGMRLFDFGDSQWASALEAMKVPFGWITEMSGVGWESVLATYTESWGLAPSELDPLWRASDLTHAVNRSLLWWGCLTESTAEEWLRWGEGPLRHLTRVLDP